MAGTTQLFNKKEAGRFPGKGEAAQALTQAL